MTGDTAVTWGGDALMFYGAAKGLRGPSSAGETPRLSPRAGGESPAAANGRAIHTQFDEMLKTVGKDDPAFEPGVRSGPTRPTASTMATRSNSSQTIRPPSVPATGSCSDTWRRTTRRSRTSTPTMPRATSRFTVWSTPNDRHNSEQPVALNRIVSTGVEPVLLPAGFERAGRTTWVRHRAELDHVVALVAHYDSRIIQWGVICPEAVDLSTAM
jgi:hypothetical protein